MPQYLVVERGVMGNLQIVFVTDNETEAYRRFRGERFTVYLTAKLSNEILWAATRNNM